MLVLMFWLLLAMSSAVQAQLSEEDLNEISTEDNEITDRTSELEWPVFRSEDDAEEERRGGMSDCRNGNTTCTQRRDGSQKESEMDDSGMNNPPNETFEPRHHDKWKLFDHKICGTSSQVRIVGGKEATLGAYPWIARIGYTTDKSEIPQFRCGAVLVTNFYVVTAAHCVANLPSKLKVGVVRLGEHNVLTDPDCKSGLCGDPVQDYKPARIVVHDHYGKPQFRNDIAIIRTEREVKFTDWIKPICIIAGPLMNKSYVGESADVAGWGIYDIDKPKPSATLQTIKLPVVENEVCEVAFKHHADISDSQMCVGGKMGEDSCGGDSGGPLMRPDVLDGPPQYFLIGVVSFGAKRCGATTMPGIYTRITSFMSWILDHMDP